MITKTYKVPAMHCTACVMVLEGLEDEVPGIEKVEASLKRLEVRVTFDDTVLDERALIKAAHQEGYELISEPNN